MDELVRRYGPALLAWGLLLWLRPSRKPGRRLVRVCVLGLAVSQTALTPVVADFTPTVGLPYAERLVGHLALLLAVWAGAQILLRLNGKDVRAHTAWAIFAGAAMVVLFVLTPDLYPQSPWVMEYSLAYAAALLPEFAVIAWLCLRDVRQAPDRVMRLGLGLIAVGIAAAAAYMISKSLVAISSRAPIDFAVGRGYPLSKALPTAAHLLVLAGVAAPAVAGWLRRYRSYRRLGPLWRDLYRAEPAIALEPPGLPTLFPTQLQLYRRVIEIRDGLLAIRPYQPADGRDEAAAIAAALRAHRDGEPPRTAAVTVDGGHDLGSDTEYLCRLADRYRRIART
ncbi:MAB_1171c family putative transporter [Kutzneria sp. 744]|uniref:MAB_1171c family putative transporter n=1 Tax=Kutzneria sp. (strain 744) TaxID=345341 RepID=UPI0004B5E43F|nr:MAB_1171c family putative transporter [Kutzneria sp. 744]